MDDIIKLGAQAGPLTLGVFVAVFLAGVALSFFWKGFGPWMMLKACKEELDKCEEHRLTMEAKVADLAARYDTLVTAVNNAGLGLNLSPTTHHKPN